MTVELPSDDNAAILIAYGSNLSSASALPVRHSASQALQRVVKTLRDRGMVVNKISRLWRSLAWPDPADPPFVNAVMQVETPMQPVELMQVLHDVEDEAGRVRDGRRNAPRILDLDLLAYGRTVLNDESGLILPHPRAADRAFVMGPLSEILPDWIHPVAQKSAKNLYDIASISQDAHPLDEDD